VTKYHDFTLLQIVTDQASADASERQTSLLYFDKKLFVSVLKVQI